MTSMVRRVDSLGRVVLPKELRRQLLIKSGDLLNISVQNEEALLIRKSSIFEFNKSYIRNLLKLISRMLNCNIYIISSDKIVYSEKEEYVGKTINKELELSKEESLLRTYISDDICIGNNITKKININGDDYGHIIYEFKNSEYPNKKIIDFSFEFLCSCIEM